MFANEQHISTDRQSLRCSQVNTRTRVKQMGVYVYELG
jgi:hypothetical protein